MIIDIPGYEGLYSLDILQNLVYSYNFKGIKRKKRISTSSGKLGHMCFTLYKNGKKEKFTIHKAVMLWKEGPRPEGMEICHNDGNPKNNHPDNLRYDTHSNNVKDMYLHGYVPYMKGRLGALHHSSIKIVQYDKCMNKIQIFESICQAGLKTNTSKGNISLAIRTGKLAGGYFWRKYA